MRLALAENEKTSHELIELINAIEYAARDMDKLVQKPMAGLWELVRAHIRLVEALAATNSDEGAGQIWVGDAGEGLAGFTAELLQHASVMAEIEPASYPALLDGLMAGRAVRSHFGLHPRIFVLGLMAAR